MASPTHQRRVAGEGHGIRVAYVLSGALVTVSSSDRPSQSLLLCHGFGPLSSRSPPCALRRRGRLAPPAHLSPSVGGSSPSAPPAITATPTARRRAGRSVVAVRCEQPGLAISGAHEGRLDHRDRQRPTAASAPRDGSDFPRTSPVGQTLRLRWDTVFPNASLTQQRSRQSPRRTSSTRRAARRR